MTRNRLYCLVIILGASLGGLELNAAEESPAPDSAATLQLDGGDRITGHLCDCEQPNILRWQSDAFATPFDFDLAAISMVHFPLRAERMRAEGDYSIEVQGGDVYFGSLLALTAEEARIEVAPFGVLHLQRKYLRRILRWRDGADLVYAGPNGLPEPEGEAVYKGPNGLKEWEREHPHGAWRQEADFLTTDRAGALLARNFDLPPQAIVEVELSWTEQPDFVFAMGAGRHGYEQAFRLEVWDDELVLLRETDTQADLASLGKVTTGAGRCHLLVYLDQQRSRATVYSPAGKLIGELAVSDAKSEPQTCIRLVNHRGKLRLEQLRVMRWDGTLPHDAQSDKPRVHRADGSVVYGEVQGFDAAAGEFLFAEGGQVTRIRPDDMVNIVMPHTDVDPPSGVRAILQDGTRVSGEFRKLENDRLWLTSPGVAETLGVPVAELKTLVSLQEQKLTMKVEGRVGRLVTENASIQGRLVVGDQRPGGCCLAWQPLGSTTAATFAARAAAQIIYREPPPSVPQPPPVPNARGMMLPGAIAPVQRVQVVQGGVIRLFARAIAGNSPNTPAPAAARRPTPAEPCLYLRTGDAIPCKVERIDERGVTFQSAMFDATFASHDKVKAVELENRSLATKVDPTSRDRLITLPRMQKDNPPTHLIRSIYGDYLRARLVGMDDTTVTVEVRLDTRELPREQVTRIIWLGEETPDDAVAAEADEDAAARIRVQTLRNDGIRFTFNAEKLDGNFLEGTSDVLGTCRVNLDEVDQVAIGAAIEEAAADLPYQRWKLHDAPLPKFAQEGGEGGGTPGMESALVGKPAPDFELAALDGSEFRLRDLRGKVVVLEFWASWCGPCVATLPLIDRTVKEFEGRGAMLVAVNLQETPEAVHTILERLELQPKVVLDRTGAVAEQYAAVAIPQTVIVDADGNVARLFVGGGRQYEEQLREALEAVLPTDEATTNSEED